MHCKSLLSDVLNITLSAANRHWYFSMVTVLVLEGQFSHSRRADHCNITYIQEKKVLKSEESVLGSHMSQRYLQRNWEEYIPRIIN